MLDSETDLVRRVPIKIAIHTGLRNTYGQKIQPSPILRKVILKPPPNQRTINLKMVKPEIIVSKLNEKRKKISPYDIGIGRLTLQKIENYGKPPSNLSPFPKPKIIRPVIHSSEPIIYYQTTKIVRPKFQYDYMAKTVVPELLTDIKFEPEPVAINPVETEKEEERVTFSSVFGKKYTGVPLASSMEDYETMRLSRQNPALAKRLAKIINYKKPDPPPERKIEYPAGFPNFLRPFENSQFDPAERQKQLSFITNESEKSDQLRPSGPVYIDECSLNSTEQSVTCALNSSNCKNVLASFNGTIQSIPEEISCHLCGSVMRLCMRKSKYREEVRGYPSYRCLKKGCQTFRAVRKVLQPDYANKRFISLNLKKVQDTLMLNPDFILGSLMEMPESRKRAYSREEDDDESAEQNFEIKVERSDIADFENVVKTEEDVIKEEDYDELASYGADHGSHESNEPFADLDEDEDDDCFKVEDDTVN